MGHGVLLQGFIRGYIQGARRLTFKGGIGGLGGTFKGLYRGFYKIQRVQVVPFKGVYKRL